MSISIFCVKCLFTSTFHSGIGNITSTDTFRQGVHYAFTSTWVSFSSKGAYGGGGETDFHLIWVGDPSI